MTKTKRLRLLGEIYAEIPKVHCKGLCIASCSTIPLMPIELRQLEAMTKQTFEVKEREDRAGSVLLGEIGEPCPVLVAGRCGAYDARPSICRIFGAANGLPCRHGCTVEGSSLTDEQSFSIFNRISRL